MLTMSVEPNASRKVVIWTRPTARRSVHHGAMTSGGGSDPRARRDDEGAPSVGLHRPEHGQSSSVDRLLDFLDDALDAPDVSDEAPTDENGRSVEPALPGVVRNPVPIRELGCVRGCGRPAAGQGDFCRPCRSWVLGDTDIDPLREPWAREDAIEIRKRHEVMHLSVFDRLRRRSDRPPTD